MLPIIMAASLSWSDPITWDAPPSDETILLVMRHGETYGNKSSDLSSYTYTGCRTNFSLNDSGMAQAGLVAKKIAELSETKQLHVSAVYSSPLSRAQETVAPIAQLLNLPVNAREGLAEIDWGIADGKLVKEIDDVWEEDEAVIRDSTQLTRQQKWDLLPVFPEAEKFNQVLARASAELAAIAAQHPGQVVLVGTHGRVIKCLIAEALDQEDDSVPYPKNAGVIVLRAREGVPLQLIEMREEM